MKVREIMTTAPITVEAGTPVMRVARVLFDNRLPGVPVVDEQGSLLGVVTEADLIVRNANLHLPRFLTFIDSLMPAGTMREFDAEVRRMLATSAGEVMSDKLVTISPEADVAEAATVMFERHANPLPVVEGGRLVGSICRSDLVRLMLLEEEQSAAESAGRQ